MDGNILPTADVCADTTGFSQNSNSESKSDRPVSSLEFLGSVAASEIIDLQSDKASAYSAYSYSNNCNFSAFQQEQPFGLFKPYVRSQTGDQHHANYQPNFGPYACRLQPMDYNIQYIGSAPVNANDDFIPQYYGQRSDMALDRRTSLSAQHAIYQQHVSRVNACSNNQRILNDCSVRSAPCFGLNSGPAYRWDPMLYTSHAERLPSPESFFINTTSPKYFPCWLPESQRVLNEGVPSTSSHMDPKFVSKDIFSHQYTDDSASSSNQSEVPSLVPLKQNDGMDSAAAAKNSHNKISEMLRNCDASSIKILAETCLSSQMSERLIFDQPTTSYAQGTADSMAESGMECSDSKPADKITDQKGKILQFYENCCLDNSVLPKPCIEGADAVDALDTGGGFAIDKSVMVCSDCQINNVRASRIDRKYLDSFLLIERQLRRIKSRSSSMRQKMRKVFQKPKINQILKCVDFEAHTVRVPSAIICKQIAAYEGVFVHYLFQTKSMDPINERALQCLCMKNTLAHLMLKKESADFSGEVVKVVFNGESNDCGLNKTDATTESKTKYVCNGKVQAHPCHDLPCVSCCQECADSLRSASDYCRFMDFRRLHKTDDEILETRGFVDSTSVVGSNSGNKSRIIQAEFSPFDVDFPVKDRTISVKTACYIIANVASQFRCLLEREKKFLSDCRRWNFTPLKEASNQIAQVPWRDFCNVRELCDICSTTIFNLHLLCRKCAFVVCMDCLKARMRQEIRLEMPGKNQDMYGWNFCTFGRTGRMHGPQDLTMAHLIPCNEDDILSTLQHLSDSLDTQVQRYGINVEDSRSFNRFMVKLPPKRHQSNQTVTIEPPLPYYFMFDHDLLVLRNAKHPDNLPYFQRHWRLAKPILIQRVTQDLDPLMWRPNVLERKCAGKSAEGTIVDCRTGAVIDNFDVAQFWAGFVDCQKRICDADSKKLYLKLKDWPSSEKFSELLKEHFESFCKALPIPHYSHPESGQYNLATYLPAFYVRPDLGPKMYIAYEMVFEPMRGTTNLHLDVSDAVNVLVHVSTPANINSNYLHSAILKHLECEGLDRKDMDRVRKFPSRIGALWTIYKPEDSETIRIFLNELAQERKSIAKFDDPIHDQMCYLHVALRKRLEEERGVKGCTFVQMLGDAVFIPAGAAHQVQNLLCCVKVAEDFVSPEGVARCATMTGEFRNLTSAHTNHEDKLQLPSIILHSVKEALRVLQQNDPRSLQTQRIVQK